jgi:hypothetical protein
MSRLAATREDLDDDHPAAAAWVGAGQDARLVRRGGLLLLRLNGARRGTEQLASTGDVGGAAAIGKQAVVTNAVEALGQHVQEESPDELDCSTWMIICALSICLTLSRTTSPARNPAP